MKRTARTHAAAPKPAPVATHAARPVAARPAAPPPPAPVAAAPAPAPAQPAAVVDLSAQPAPKPAPAKPATSNTANMLPYAAGALVLLALIAIAALVASRRRRRALEAADEDMAYESYETEPVSEAQPEPEPVVRREEAVRAPASAFAWGTQPQVQEERAEASSTSDLDDRRPGESWVERAYRGPSPSNPSASLRNRLSRAAFFDKRERDVAAGLAEPVDPTAGLPDAMVEEQERENA